MITRRIVVHGYVQGVGYRDALSAQAQSRSVAGWVRNCSDGTVEAVLQGDDHSVQAVILWAHRGPPSARVTHIDVEDHCGTFSSFALRPSV